MDKDDLSGASKVDRCATRTVTVLESDLPKLVVYGQLSRRTSYSLRVDGPFDEKEADALMRLLAVQWEVMKADAAETPGATSPASHGDSDA